MNYSECKQYITEKIVEIIALKDINCQFYKMDNLVELVTINTNLNNSTKKDLLVKLIPQTVVLEYYRRMTAIGQILRSLILLKEYDTANDHIYLIEELFEKASIYSVLSTAYFQDNMEEKGWNSFYKALSISYNIVDVWNRQQLFKFLVIQLSFNGKEKQALFLLDEMDKENRESTLRSMCY